MYDLKLVDGDLAVAADGSVNKITGADRIRQELTCWLLEPIGTDVMYGNFGSHLGEYIGTAITNESMVNVRAEVVRVVNNYIAYQKKQYQQATRLSTSSLINSWSGADLIASVDRISVDAVADSIKVMIKLTTMAGMEISVEEVL